MKELTAAVVCIAVLYGVDAIFCDGRYCAVVSSVISQVYMHW